MLFTRYGGAAQDVLSLECDDFIEQINFVINERTEEDVRIRWINGYQSMTLDEFKQAIHYKKPSECMVEDKPIEDVLKNLLFEFG